jgi:hypothetical protein
MEDRDLRERVVRLEVQVEDLIKRVDALQKYNRQLFEYLNQGNARGKDKGGYYDIIPPITVIHKDG